MEAKIDETAKVMKGRKRSVGPCRPRGVPDAKYPETVHNNWKDYRGVEEKEIVKIGLTPFIFHT
jgi:hypothetical protein